MILTRRHALLAGAALPFAAAAPAILIGRPARAEVPLQGAQAAVPFHRFALGAFEVTTLLAGTMVAENPHEIFGLNVAEEDFAKVSTEAFIPVDRTQFFFSPTLVNTGTGLVLFDTGMNPEGITAALAAAGVTPDQIDTVVVTHMHPDHIGGLGGAAGPTFANATYVAGAAENDFWAGASNEGYEALVRPLLEKTKLIDAGAEVAAGITSQAAFGHSPGHMVFQIESDGKRLMLTADTANHYVWSLAQPDWEVKFDADKPAAAATRRAVFGEIAADRIAFVGYHMPFPSVGFVEAAGDGFRYVPASYQTTLGL